MTDKQTRDTLYSSGFVPEDFQFNGQVAEVFDDMLTRSVPLYQQTIDLTAFLLGRFLARGALVYDLGCATGATLLTLASRLADLDLQLTGIDNAPAMLEKARTKAALLPTGHRISFCCGDILTIPLQEADAIICNYTLQFIRPLQRPALLARLHATLAPSGLLIVSEKTISHHARLNRALIDTYHQFKTAQGYSVMEVAAKREALENVLVPFSLQENIDMLRQAGFSHVEPCALWCNFATVIAFA